MVNKFLKFKNNKLSTNHKDIGVFSFIKLFLFAHSVILTLSLGFLLYLINIKGYLFFKGWDLFIINKISLVSVLLGVVLFFYLIMFIVMALARLYSKQNIGFMFFLLFIFGWFFYNAELLINFDYIKFPEIKYYAGYFSINFLNYLINLKPLLLKITFILYWLMFFRPFFYHLKFLYTIYGNSFIFFKSLGVLIVMVVLIGAFSAPAFAMDGTPSPSLWQRFESFCYYNDGNLSGAVIDEIFGPSKATLRIHEKNLISIPEEMGTIQKNINNGNLTPQEGQRLLYSREQDRAYSKSYCNRHLPLGYSDKTDPITTGLTVVDRPVSNSLLIEDRPLENHWEALPPIQFEELVTEPSSEIPNSISNVGLDYNSPTTGRRRTLFDIIGGRPPGLRADVSESFWRNIIVSRAGREESTRTSFKNALSLLEDDYR